MIKHGPMRNLTPRIWGKRSPDSSCVCSVETTINEMMLFHPVPGSCHGPGLAGPLLWPLALCDLPDMPPAWTALSETTRQGSKVSITHLPFWTEARTTTKHLPVSQSFSKPWVCLIPTTYGSLRGTLFTSKDQTLVLWCFVSPAYFKGKSQELINKDNFSQAKEKWLYSFPNDTTPLVHSISSPQKHGAGIVGPFCFQWPQPHN